MDSERKRIKILEFLGWTELTRKSKLGGFMALRGTSPEGKPNQIAPNPILNLNEARKALLFCKSKEEFCWGSFSIELNRVLERNHWDSQAEILLATAEQICTAIIETIKED